MEASQQLCSGALVALLLLISGCASPGPPLPPSLELPTPVTDLRAVRNADQVYLSWTVPAETTDHQALRHLGPTRICRSIGVMTTCGTVVGQVPPPSLTSPTHNSQPVLANYTDTLPRDLQLANPASHVLYAVSVLNGSGRSAGLSNLIEVPAAPTLTAPATFNATVTADGVVLAWSPVNVLALDDLHYLYRVYRKQDDNKAEMVVAEVPLGSETRFTDRSFEWEKTYHYRVGVMTVIPQPGKPESQVGGEATPPQTVVTHDVFPPAVPSGLQAVASGVGQAPFIDLIWSSVADADLAGYNIYRHEPGGIPVKINPALVQTPAYRDTSTSPGRSYFYSVSAVDLRGNESSRSEETNETLP
jgi:hypothetical protein